MEVDKRVLSAITLCIIISMLYMYREVNVIKLNSKSENDSMMKKIKSYDDFQSNFETNVESKLKSLMVRSEESNE